MRYRSSSWGVTMELDIIDNEIADDLAKVRKLDATLNSLHTYRNQIAETGMSRSVGVGLEHIAPDLTESIDIRKLTQTPSTAFQQVALEAIDWKMKIGVGLLGLLIVGLLAKILQYILGVDVPKGGGGGGAEVKQKIEDIRDQVRDEVNAMRNAEPADILLNFNKQLPDALKPHAAKLAEMVRNHKLTNHEALEAVNQMLVYSQKTYPVQNQEELLGILFKLLTNKPNARIALSALAFDLHHDFKNQNFVPAFLEDVRRYSAGIRYVDETLKMLEQLIGASKDASDLAKTHMRNRENTPEENRALGMAEVQRALAAFNGDMPNFMDRTFGFNKGMDTVLPFMIDPNGDIDPTLSPEGLKQMHEELGHAYGENELRGRTQKDLKIKGPQGEEYWWGQGFNRYDNLGVFSLKLDEAAVNFGDMKARGIVLSVFDPKEAARFVTSADKQRDALNKVFADNRHEIDQLVDRCKRLEKILREINVMSKERVPTLYDAFYDGTMGRNFPDYIRKMGDENRVNWGKLTERVLRYTKDYAEGIRSVKVLYARVASRYRVLKSLLE